jgi:hypothetical protein
VACVLIFLPCSMCICQCVVLFLLSFILPFYLFQIQTHRSKAKRITNIIFNSEIFFFYSDNCILKKMRALKVHCDDSHTYLMSFRPCIIV